MMRFSGALILMFLLVRVTGQDLLFEKEITLETGFKDRRDALPIVNYTNQEIMLFLLDKNEIKGLRLSMNYALIDEVSAARPEKKFSVLLGHSISNNEYHLFFTNDRKDEFYVQSINVSSKESTGSVIPLNISGEEFLETVSYNNKFYLLTVIKKSSILCIYAFTGNTLTTTRELDFAGKILSGTGYLRLFDVLTVPGDNPFRLNLQIQKIDNSNPNPLDITTRKNKLYYSDNKIYMTIDNNLENTKMIIISLDDFSYDVRFLTQISIDSGDEYYIKSNSYLYNNFLFQIKGCQDELSFQIVDLKNDSIKKVYRVREDEEISFSNSALLQEGGTVQFLQGTERELKKTGQALRKIAHSNIGITVNSSGSNLELTIGGYKEVQRSGGGGGGMMMTTPGMSFSTPSGQYSTAPTYHYNPGMYGYSSYANSRSVYFKSLLDSADFSHMEGNIPDNAYDLIRDYDESLDEDPISKTIFKVDNYYVMGYYNETDNKYYLLKFDK